MTLGVRRCWKPLPPRQYWIGTATTCLCVWKMAVYSLYRNNMKRSGGARPKYSQTLHTMAIINCAIFISSLYTPHYSKWIKSLSFKVKQSFILWTARDINTTCDIFLRLLRICHRTEKMAPLFNKDCSQSALKFKVMQVSFSYYLPP